MTDRTHIEQSVRAFWKARLRDDLDAMMNLVADNAVYEMNARGTGVPDLEHPTKGKAAIMQVCRDLMDLWHFENWREIDLSIDGDKGILHWKARATCVPTQKSGEFDVVDVFRFRDGKIVDMRENTDTALIMKLAA